MRKSEEFFLRGIVFVGLVFVLTSCSPRVSVSQRPTPPVMTPSPSSLSATPFRDSSPALGPIPYGCPSGSLPQNINSHFGPAIGSSPVWAGAGSFDKRLPLRLEWSQSETSMYRTQYGWNHKFLWVIAARYQGIVTITGTNLRDGSFLYPQAQDSALASTPTILLLDTRSPTIANRTDTWLQFPGGLIIPKAGCYILEAKWSGGSWRIPFAAGVQTS